MSGSLQSAFHLSDRGLVCIVGAGGKTTLMFRLARELAAAGNRVLTTTTTKIYYPTLRQSSHVLVEADPLRLIRKTDAFYLGGFHLTAAMGFDEATRKLSGYPPDVIDLFWKSGRFQWILVEADGASGKPLKAPAAHEPVIPGESTVLVAVAGLDAVGKPLTEDRVFRSHLYSRITGCPLGKPITPESVCRVLTHPEGITKGCPATAKKFVFLVSAQMPFPKQTGQMVGARLAQEDRGCFRDVLMGNIGNGYMEMESLMSFETGPTDMQPGAVE